MFKLFVSDWKTAMEDILTMPGRTRALDAARRSKRAASVQAIHVPGGCGRSSQMSGRAVGASVRAAVGRVGAATVTVLVGRTDGVVAGGALVCEAANRVGRFSAASCKVLARAGG